MPKTCSELMRNLSFLLHKSYKIHYKNNSIVDEIQGNRKLM
jgi:hypothetical protein